MRNGNEQQPIEPSTKGGQPAIENHRPAVNGTLGDASDRSRSFQLILSEGPLRRFELLFQRHRVQARIGLVLVSSRGEYYSFPCERRPTIGELLWKCKGMLYEIDMGIHYTRLEFNLPSREEAFVFPTVVDVEWRVTDPAQVVKDGINDVREVLWPAFYSQLSMVTRQFDIEDAAIAEKNAYESLVRRPVGGEYGLSNRVFLRMKMDQPTVTYAALIRDAQRGIKLEHENQKLRLLSEESKTALITKRVERYRAIIQAGDYNQFALQLAQNPDEAPAVVKMLREERRENRRNVINFVARLLDSHAIDRYEIDDQVRTALDWLKDATDTVLRSPEAPVSIPSQRNFDTIPDTDVPEAAIPDPLLVDLVPPPESAPTLGAEQL